ncbi:MAG: sigma-70 family RNA polymerase sigma factor [Firmicutes bacterium]|nr:sigma-70 family RNA polymerase sigma factor [Bacillota bacterium]MCM1401599.1 sigma-70 family RNA polymerase sigma factor [Bacteroides sp.]MCM1477239.1 sigma-70 family RNA polymerase sigma factor [Bacteroides sp.]
MKANDQSIQRFTQILKQHDALIYKVCYMYAEDSDHLKDLYQEVAANLWNGLEGFEGKSKVSTWVYRISLNTCITYFRKHGKHSATLRLDAAACDVEDTDSDRTSKLKFMYELIGQLGKIDKAIVMLWLDEHSYDEIAQVVGLSRANVASRLYRAKQKLAIAANE